MFGDVGQERDHVVIGGLFDLADPVDLESGLALDGRPDLCAGIRRASQARISISSQMANLFSSVQI